jgi:hypothetical protein
MQGGVSRADVQRRTIEHSTYNAGAADALFHQSLSWGGLIRRRLSASYCPFAAALFPSLAASASVMYLPFLVVP